MRTGRSSIRRGGCLEQAATVDGRNPPSLVFAFCRTESNIFTRALSQLLGSALVLSNCTFILASIGWPYFLHKVSFINKGFTSGTSIVTKSIT